MSEIQFVTSEAGEAVISLKGKMTVERAAELHKTLVSAFQECQRIRMDVEGLEHVDLTFFQIVSSCYKTANLESKNFCVVSMPQWLRIKAQTAGFTFENTEGFFWKGEEHGQENYDR